MTAEVNASLPVKSDAVTERLPRGGLSNSDSLLPAVLSRVCFKLFLASPHGFLTAILRTIVLWGATPFVGASAVKREDSPTRCYRREFPRSLCVFLNKFCFLLVALLFL